jgi:hypothetical protein
VTKRQKRHLMPSKRCLTILHLLGVSKSLYNSLSLLVTEPNKLTKLLSLNFSQVTKETKQGLKCQLNFSPLVTKRMTKSD